MLETAAAYFYRNMLKMRHPAELAWVVVYPVIGILSIGIFAVFLFLQDAPSLNPLFFVAAGALVWDTYGLMQKSVAFSLMFEIWDGSIRHAYLPRSRFLSFLTGNLGFGAVTAAAAAIVVISISYFAFGFDILSAGIHLLASLASVSLFAAASGLIIISIILTKGHYYMSLIWITTGIVMVLSGVYYPIEVMPEPIRTVGDFIPATHSISALRGSLGLEGVDVTHELVKAFAYSGALFAFAIWFYFRSVKKARVKGMLNER